MTISGVGFDGTVAEADWARLSGPQGIPDQTIPGQSTTDYQVTLSTTALSATVTPGIYNRHGILAKSTATETVTFSNPASGSRYDAVCLLIDWTTNTVSLVVVQGTTTPAIPWASLLKTPGTQAHVPLALVKLTSGNAAPVSRTDLRWGTGWKTAATYSPNGFTNGGSDPAQWRVLGGVCYIRGAVQWESGDGTDVGMLVGMPVPDPGLDAYGQDITVGSAHRVGGVKPLMLNVSSGELFVPSDSTTGTWSQSGTTYIRLSGSYLVV